MAIADRMVIAVIPRTEERNKNGYTIDPRCCERGNRTVGASEGVTECWCWTRSGYIISLRSEAEQKEGVEQGSERADRSSAEEALGCSEESGEVGHLQRFAKEMPWLCARAFVSQGDGK